jgi:Tfp pilus assembly protein PilO
MTESQRLTYLKIGAISVVGLWLLDFIVITPVVNSWGEQSDRIAALRQKVDRGQQLLDRQDSIREHWARMVGANLPAEVSAAEDVAYQAIGRWAAASGISFASLTPQWQDHDEGYQTFECRASATGTQASLSRFIYEMETDKVPVNLDEFEITTRDDRGALLTMTARFSFLRLNASGSATP